MRVGNKKEEEHLANSKIILIFASQFGRWHSHPSKEDDIRPP